MVVDEIQQPMSKILYVAVFSEPAESLVDVGLLDARVL